MSFIHPNSIKNMWSKVNLNNYFEGSAQYTINNEKDELLVIGSSLNYLAFPKNEFAIREKALEVTLSVSSLKIRDNLTLNNFEGLFKLSSKLEGSGSGRLNDGPNVRVNFQIDSEGRNFVLFSKNAGDVLSIANIYPSGYGGEVQFEFFETFGQSIEGSISVENLKVIGAPLLAKIISFTSIDGIIEGLRSDGMIFEKVKAKYKLKDTILTISDGVALNSSFGLTLAGTRKMDQKIINYSGVLSPAYTLNTMVKKIPFIGEIIGGNEGEGTFGISYNVKGNVDQPEVKVNPLSLITPGQFRNFLN